MKILFTPAFMRQLESLPIPTQREVALRIEMLRKIPPSPILHMHKLKGELRGFYACTVDYHTRIIFEYLDKKSVILLHDVGDHGIYER